MRYFPVLVVMSTIFLLSHQTGDSLDLPSIFGLDKVCHAIIYAVLAAAAMYAVADKISFKNISPNLYIILFCVLYGISDEFHQSFIPNRSPSIFDVIADGFGATMTVISWKVLKNNRRINQQ